jgi:hypothetical protein
MSSGPSDLADGIVQDSLPTHTEPPRDEFLPWHKVRKEYIRRFQWNELARRLVTGSWRRHLNIEEADWSLGDPEKGPELQLPDGVFLERALACLVIPGEDLLDVRALWRDVQGLNCWIRYLGFNESHGSNQIGTRVHIANNDVTSLPNVWKNSRVVQDRFEAIAGGPNSQAYRYLKEYGPYHIVNLDLCGSLFPNTADDCRKYYEALNRLLAYQFEFQKTEWLLFVTTMVEPGAAHVDTLKSLCLPTRENYHQHPDFAARVATFLPKEAFPSGQSTIDLTVLNEHQVIHLFGVAFGKWLVKLCQKAQPQWTVAMRRSYRYSINEEKGAVMLSLAFEMKPNIAPPVDSTGMSNLGLQQKKFPTELECAIKIAESVGNIRDVDAELTAHPDLKAELQEAQANLLESAGYDRAAFIKWASEGEITPQ